MSERTISAVVLDRLDLVLHTPGKDGEPSDDVAVDADPALPGWDLITTQDPGWAWVRAAYGLGDFELDVLLVALAPEIDLRYVRVMARLQDDPGACRPTVDLVLRLLSPPGRRLAARAVFRADGPLLAGGLISLVADPRLVAPVLPTHHIVIDEQIADVLLRQGGLDRRLVDFVTLTAPAPGRWESVPLPAAERDRLLAAVRAAADLRPFRLHLYGPVGAGSRTAAEALAGELGMPLLRVDLAAAADADPARSDRMAATIARVVREAALHGAMLHLADVDGLLTGSAAASRAAVEALAGHPGVLVLSGTAPWVPAGAALPGVLSVSLAKPPFTARLEAWRHGLVGAGADPLLADELAVRFHGGPDAISDAMAAAVSAAGGTAPGRGELFAAARGRSAHHLADLARRIEPGYGWADLVLPTDSTAQLRDLCRRVTLGRKVWHDWGFEQTIAHGRGATALFAGPSGTGKTMAAEVVARELAIDLFAIDLSAVVSKYIGETEKNLERIFTAASEADAILMFDEADALFGKRSQVRDAHDRYANVETAYLLQRMERYEGVAILATNLRTHLDEAFTRRLQFVVDFPFPDDEHRRRIWAVSFPPAAPVDPDLDLHALAREVRLAGGNIRNVALHAAFLAAADGGLIGDREVRAAVAHEYRKLGRVLPDAVAATEPIAAQG